MELKERVKTYRENRKLTRKAVAELTGVTKDIVRAYERGITKLNPSWLSRFVSALNIRCPEIDRFIRIPHIQTVTRTELEMLYEAYTLKQIGEFYGCARSVVRRRMRELDIRMKGVSQIRQERAYYAQGWRVKSDGIAFVTHNLKRFCNEQGLRYTYVYHRIQHHKCYQDDEIYIERNPIVQN